MRVISGKFRGRKLKAVPGLRTRPTTDKVKEAVFNMLGLQINGLVLDLFAGSGALAIEAVSRGADFAVLVDRQYQAIKTIKENIALTKEINNFEIIKADAFRILKMLAEKNYKFNYVFLDPPYKQQKIVAVLQQLKELNLLAKDAIIVCETDQQAQLPETITGYTLWKRADYGITEVTFYQLRGE